MTKEVDHNKLKGEQEAPLNADSPSSVETMKTKLQKTMALLLSVLMAGSVFVSCDDKSKNEGDGTGELTIPSSTPEEEGSPSFEGIDLNEYKGTTVKIAMPLAAETTYCDMFLYAQNYTGDTVNDAVYERNKKVEDRFGITLEFYSSETVAPDLRKLIMTDDNPYEIAFINGVHLSSLLQSGYLKDLNELKYCDFTKEYWDQNCYENLSFGGKNYYMISDISSAMMYGSAVVFFNKNMIEEFKLESPYELVDSNEWIWEKYIEMGMVVSADLNNDGKWDENDRYGAYGDTVGGSMLASGVRYTRNNADGIPEIVFLKENADRTIEIYNMLCDAAELKGLHLSEDSISETVDQSAYMHKWDYCRGAMFGGDRVLFCTAGLRTSDLLTNMESDYGIVPLPKYDAEQSEYYSTIDYNFSWLTIPITNQRMDFISCVLEYMAYASTDTVNYAFYDKVMKGQRASDPDTVRMLELIRGTMLYDFAINNDIGIASTVSNSVSKRTLTSSFASNERSIQRKLQNLIEQFG